MTRSKKGRDKDEQVGDDLLAGIKVETTEEVEVPELLIDQVIGQDHGVEVIKKAANQRRHVMLIGTPGTGKSMLANSMAELLPKEELQDILTYPNAEDKNNPKIRIVPRGKGKEIVDAQRQEVKKRVQIRNIFFMFISFLIIGMGVIYALQTTPPSIIYVFWSIIAAAVVMLVFKWIMPREESMIPKLLVSNAESEIAPFVDATGSHSGALLGDVRHDPYQSGGLETPAHDRVEAGALHKAHKGVLFLDELNTLKIEAQQSLLTAMQEKKYSITGQSERSAGAMVKTDPVPCDFIMVAAGNLDAMAGIHPALRSRIKGYGYEIYMKDTMDDTLENREKIVRFISQEVKKDKKIPHFNRTGIKEILREARRRSGRKGQLTLTLRDLGGLVRVAGDIARAKGAKYTTGRHVINAKAMAKSVEQQVADEYLEQKKDYKLFVTEGFEIGRVNGLAVIGDSGVMLPILAEVTPAQSREEGRVIATGRLQEISQEAVQNVSAVFKKFTGKDISRKDIHIQFVGTHEGVEGDSASISVATAVISSLENIPVDQSIAMTGSLSVRGDILPVGGITAKIEAAVQAGVKKVLIPQSNLNDVLIEDRYKNKVTIIPLATIEDVLEHALVGKMKKKFIEKIRKFTMIEKIIPDGVLDKQLIP